VTKSPESATGWIFPSNNKGKIDGFNDASIDTFIGTRTYSVVRETIQNSLDVRVDPAKPVEVHFRLDELAIREVEAVKNIDSFLLAAKRAASQDVKATDFYNNALSLLTASRNVPFLSIHDSNATGLIGETEIDLESGLVSSWFALVKGSGVSVKFGTNAGGSYGHGSKATLGVSQLRSVFYLSITEENGELLPRFQGKSILQSMQIDATQTQGTGFYGTKFDLGPIFGDSIPQWARELRRSIASGTGTSIFIPFPDLHDVEDVWTDIEFAVLANFYYAIEQNQLLVTLGDGEVLSADTIESRFEVLCERLQSAPSGSDAMRDLAAALTINVARSNGTFGTLESRELGQISWFLRLGDNVVGQRVGICRNGMLITSAAPFLKNFQGLKKFDLFLAVQGEQGKTLLRKLENPAHNQFDFDRILDKDESRSAKTQFERFTKEVRAFLKEHASLEVADEMTISDLDDIFGDVGETPESGPPLESVGDSDSVVVKRPRKRKPSEGALSELDTEDGMSEEGGTLGGEGTRQPNSSTGEDGHGATEGQASRGPRALSGRQVKDLRIVPDPNEAGGVRVYFTPVVEGEFDFYLYRSGDSVREPINFRTSPGGDLKSSLPLKAKKKLERIKILLYVDADDLHNAFEGVMK